MARRNSPLFSLANRVMKKDVPISDLSSDYQSDDSNEKAVSLRHGALSLIELLAAAAKENCNVMWK
jgi:hypothetical protein